jgi:hypothetical protein
MNHLHMDSPANIATKTSPATTKSLLAAGTAKSLLVVDVDVIPSPTTSHTPSFHNPISFMKIEDVEHGSREIHRSSVRDTSFMGSGSASGGCPPRSRKPKNIFKPCLA